jgi:hypothetical protein
MVETGERVESVDVCMAIPRLAWVNDETAVWLGGMAIPRLAWVNDDRAVWLGFMAVPLGVRVRSSVRGHRRL